MPQEQSDETVEVATTDNGPDSNFHAEQFGDVLFRIARSKYGNAGRNLKTFEVNQLVLTDPNRLYFGQALGVLLGE